MTGNVFIFIVGACYSRRWRSVPPLLQDLLNYPVVTTGLVTAPRGLGTFCRHVRRRSAHGQDRHPSDDRCRFRIDRFLAMADGGLRSADGYAIVIWSGMAQGLGTGLLSRAAGRASHSRRCNRHCATKARPYSVCRATWAAASGSRSWRRCSHATPRSCTRTLAEHVIAFSPSSMRSCPVERRSLKTPVGLNAPVTKQAAMIAYNNDFKLMMVLSLASIPLVLVAAKGPATRSAKRSSSSDPGMRNRHIELP